MSVSTDYEDYYSAHSNDHELAKKAEELASAKTVSTGLLQQIADMRETLNKTRIQDPDVDGTIVSFNDTLTAQNDVLTKLSEFAESYADAETAYTELVVECDTLQKADQTLKELCASAPNSHDSKYVIADTDPVEYNTGMYNYDKGQWEQKVRALKADCKALSDNIDNYIAYLEAVNNSNPADGMITAVRPTPIGGTPMYSASSQALSFEELNKYRELLGDGYQYFERLALSGLITDESDYDKVASEIMGMMEDGREIELQRLMTKIPDNILDFAGTEWVPSEYTLGYKYPINEGYEVSVAKFNKDGYCINVSKVVNVSEYPIISTIMDNVYTYNMVNEVSSYPEEVKQMMRLGGSLNYVISDDPTHCTAGAAAYGTMSCATGSMIIPTVMGGQTIWNYDESGVNTYDYLFNSIRHETGHVLDDVMFLTSDTTNPNSIKLCEIIDENMVELEHEILGVEVENWDHNHCEGFAETLRCYITDPEKFREVVGDENTDEFLRIITDTSDTSKYTVGEDGHLSAIVRHYEFPPPGEGQDYATTQIFETKFTYDDNSRVTVENRYTDSKGSDYTQGWDFDDFGRELKYWRV